MKNYEIMKMICNNEFEQQSKKQRLKKNDFTHCSGIVNNKRAKIEKSRYVALLTRHGPTRYSKG